MIIHPLFILLLFLHSHLFLTGALNFSDFLPHHSPPSHFLQDVLKAIAVSKRWDIESIKAWKMEKVRYGYSSKDAFFAKIGKKRNMVLRLSHQVNSWNNLQDDVDFEHVLHRVSSEAVLRPFQVHGPCLLVVSPNHTLSLPLSMNKTFSGLKQIFIGEGITVEINGAQEFTFGMSSCNTQLTNTSRINFWPFPEPLHLIHVMGSASVTPFKDYNFSNIQHSLVAKNIIKLIPKKCYPEFIIEKPPCPLNMSSRIVALKHLLKSLFGEFHHYRYQNHSLHLYKASIRASNIVEFQLELRRDVGINSQLVKWRTQPLVQRYLFDVVASLDMEKLKPLKVKMVRPFIDIDSGYWSDILSNVSFTKYSNVLVPSLPLTLDVKW